MMKVILSFILLAVTVNAGCDNQCSGHGTCGTDDVCTCYDNWGVGLSHDSGDCSERVCPYEFAWVDTPDATGSFHKYAECGGRGICDRSTGECACIEGYEGKGCQRLSCPNDCSGHGTCEYIEDLAYDLTWGEISITGQDETLDGSEIFSYNNWDEKKIRGCKCDALYGDVDCSKRMCPFGTDVLDISRMNYDADERYQKQVINFIPMSTSGGATAALTGNTFAITFKSRLNESYTTTPIAFPDVTEQSLTDFANIIKMSLLKLPNRVVDGVSVSARYVGASSALAGSVIDSSGNIYSSLDTTMHTNTPTISPTNAPNLVPTTQATSAPTTSAALLAKWDSSTYFYKDFVSVTVTFTGNAVQGHQHLLMLTDYECSDGCTPKINGLNLETRLKTYAPDRETSIIEVQNSDFNSYECGRRGKCDYSTGLCTCFTGYTGENCNTQTTLV